MVFKVELILVLVIAKISFNYISDFVRNLIVAGVCKVLKTVLNLLIASEVNIHALVPQNKILQQVEGVHQNCLSFGGAVVSLEDFLKETDNTRLVVFNQLVQVIV